MRITTVNIPKKSINNGLEAVTMQKLGQVVLLAGKNGAGKTRLLNLISNTINTKPSQSHQKQVSKQIDQYKMQLVNESLNVESFQKAIDAETEKNKILELEQHLVQFKTNIDNYNKAIEDSKKILEWDLITTDTEYENYTIIPFVPKSLEITDCNSFRKTDLISNASVIDQVGVSRLNTGTFARIQVIQDRWFNATHQYSNLTHEDKENAVEDYEKLKDLISLFLNTNIERSIDGEPTLFGFPLGQSNLSDGQKILLQMCLAIHCQSKSLDELILFLDEPENHLHPSVIIETIERIIKRNTNGQIWISTHSIPLLSYFDPSNIWFVENNRVSYAGSGPEKVLKSLLGSDSEIAKLQDFISLPGVFALNRHAFESLFHPEVVITDGADPQTLQIRDEIKKHLKTDSKIRILDFGAGKGRLLANIIENNSEPVLNFIKWFDYIAYDKFESDKEKCLNTISSIYPNADDRYFNDYTKLFSKYDRESFDVVIMSNVLHEIDPNSWLKLFSTGGEITRLLSDNGILLLVEDQEMLIGEKAYQKGFIVLDTSDLKELFKIKESDSEFTFSDARNDGRLKAHRIPKKYLSRITAKTRVKALKQIHATASDKILEIRKSEINYKNGKKHGFWIQQFANTGLALAELK